MMTLKEFKAIYTLFLALIIGIVLAIILMATISTCSASPKPSKPNSEVVLVTDTLIKSHDWTEAYFDISCVDSIQMDNGYYWFIYDDPDAFETVRTVSMNYKTYRALRKLIHIKDKGIDMYIPTPKIYDEDYKDRFHLLYGDCEETILIFE